MRNQVLIYWMRADDGTNRVRAPGWSWTREPGHQGKRVPRGPRAGAAAGDGARRRWRQSSAARARLESLTRSQLARAGSRYLSPIRLASHPAGAAVRRRGDA